MANSLGDRRRIRSALPAIFSLWTLFVWGGRLRNLWQEPGPLSDVSRWSLVGSIVFCVLGIAVLALWSAQRRTSTPGRRLDRPLLAAVGALAGFTTAVWVVRAIDIAAGDHSIGFIVVHVVLALVSIALAVAAWLAVRRGNRPSEANVTGEPSPAPVR